MPVFLFLTGNMGRRKKGLKINGWINLNKPAGITSTQALNIVRRSLDAQKAGHAGTLDPLATGVLPLALGEATKTIPYVQDAFKIYNFTVTWGQQRTTDDQEGDIIAVSDQRPAREAIAALLPSFTGDITQTPPQFSAIKIDGQRAYDLAREGETVEIKPRQVFIERLDIVSHDGETTAFTCTCGKGTYVRSLARDMGLKLGCFGYISALERAAVGGFLLDSAIPLDFFRNLGENPDLDSILLPVQTALDDIPALALNDTEAGRIRQGQPLVFVSRPDIDRLTAAGFDLNIEETAVAVTPKGKAVAIVNVRGAEISPVKILNL